MSTGDADTGYARLEDEIRWYSRKSQEAQRWFKRLKIAEVACAALVPVAASYLPLVAAFLGAAIVLLEAIQHLNQWQHLWVTYRATAEALKHEKYSYLGE